MSIRSGGEMINVRDCGAVGDGKTLDKEAIRKAVEIAAARGGGTVYFPPGTYLSGTVFLQSHTTMFLEPGATLLGTKDLCEYEVGMNWPEGQKPRNVDWFAALIRAEGAQNISIVGRGAIDGNQVFNPHGEEKMRGPHAVHFHGCHNILLQDVTVRNASNYAFLLTDCRDISITGVMVEGGWDAVHGREIKDVTVSDCRFYTGDDCIAGTFWQDAVITNCLLNTSCNAFRLAGENIVISNCLIYGPGKHPHRTSDRTNTLAGFNFWPGWRAFKNVQISNVSMVNVRSPLWMRLQNEEGVMKNITINNLSVTGAEDTAFCLQGMENNPVEDVALNNVRIRYKGGAPVQPAQQSEPLGSVYETSPAYGLYFRHVGKVELHNVHIDFEEPDQRPALVCHGVRHLVLDTYRAEVADDAKAPLKLIQVNRVRTHNTDIPSSFLTEKSEAPE